ncbi:7085_t:CDS:1, partial [Cetraspora pellucida]
FSIINKMSSTFDLTLPSLEIQEVYVDDEEEYIPLLTTHRHYFDHPESDNKEEEEKMKLSTGGARTKKHKSLENK